MNCFEVFDLQIAINIDTAALRKKFIELQRANHPDLATNTYDESFSTKLNEAYETLKDDNKRITHVLSLTNMLGNAADNAPLLMEMMEWSDKIEEAQNDVNQTADIVTDLTAMREELIALIKTTGQAWDLSKNEQDLKQICTLYNKVKYVERLLKLAKNEVEL